jgi:hypothetical protein
MGQVLVAIEATPMNQAQLHMVVDIKLVIIQLLKVLAMEQGWGHIQRMELAIQVILVAGVNTFNQHWVRTEWHDEVEVHILVHQGVLPRIQAGPLLIIVTIVKIKGGFHYLYSTFRMT